MVKQRNRPKLLYVRAKEVLLNSDQLLNSDLCSISPSPSGLIFIKRDEASEV